jgi:CHAT domain-containing protein/Tfp pilus assembly protein PilF
MSISKLREGAEVGWLRASVVSLLLLCNTVSVSASANAESNPDAGEKSLNPGLAAAIQLYRTEGAEASLPEFEKLLMKFRSTGARPEEAVTLRYIGKSQWQLGQLDDSRVNVERALRLVRDLGDRLGEGKTLNVLGLLEWDLGNYAEALAALEEAYGIAHENGQIRLMASTLNNMGLVHDELGDYQTSLDEFRRSYELFVEADDLRGQGDALGNTGGVHQALAISEKLESKPAMTIDHGNIALCMLGMGQTAQALVHFDRALGLARDTGMVFEEAYWQRGKAGALIRQGRYEMGLENHLAALSSYRNSGARGLVVDSLHDLGQLYLELGDPISAGEYFQLAMETARDIGHEQAITLNLLALGDLRLHMEQREEASALYREAQTRARDAGELDLEATASLRLSHAAHESAAFEDAATHANAALKTGREIGARSTEAEALLALANARRSDGDTPRALTAYEQSFAVAESLGDPHILWQIHFGKAMTQVATGERDKAVTELLAAVSLIESVRNRISKDRFRSGYLEDKFQVYVELVRLQLDLGLTADAFSTAERLRTQSFLTQIDWGAPIAQSESEKQTELAHRERIQQLQELLSEEQEKQRTDRRQMALTTFSVELRQAERDYQFFLDDMRSRFPALNSLDVPEVAQIQQHLQPGDALLEYVVADNEILTFLIGPEHIEATRYSLGREELNAKIQLLRSMIQQPAGQRWVKPAASLSGVLLQQLIDRQLLVDVKHLYLVPHGILNYLPFAVLPLDASGDQLLMERYTLSYLPAASTLTRNNEELPSEMNVLALAPDRARLRWAPEEARSIAEMFEPDSRLLDGKSATESALKNEAGNYAVIHFATHAYINSNNPMLSGLELETDSQNDGRLEVHEILDLVLDARLVTLSACQTGLGSGWFNAIPAGDDFVGLTRAFLFAGSKSVLASLWEVDDHSTVGLMEGFYRRLDGSSSAHVQAASLAEVQREMRISEEFNHPFYWAPFVLVGQHGSDAPG